VFVGLVKIKFRVWFVGIWSVDHKAFRVIVLGRTSVRISFLKVIHAYCPSLPQTPGANSVCECECYDDKANR
jgi:hypothetical protein